MNRIFLILFQRTKNCCVSKRILKTVEENKLTNIANTLENCNNFRKCNFHVFVFVNFKLVDLYFLIIKKAKEQESKKIRNIIEHNRTSFIIMSIFFVM